MSDAALPDADADPALEIEGAPWERDWLNWTDQKYYYRIRRMMIDAGIEESSVDIALSYVWENGWLAGRDYSKDSN